MIVGVPNVGKSTLINTSPQASEILVHAFHGGGLGRISLEAP